MPGRKVNIGNNIIDAMLILLFLFFMLSVTNHGSAADSDKTKHGISCENTLSQSSAIIKISTSLIFNQKTWASEKKYPEIINSFSCAFFENRKTSNQISLQSAEVFMYVTKTIFIFHYHLFSTEKEDIPVLS
jgi:hypothetical protein